VKNDSAGEEQWVARYNGPGNKDNVASAIGIDGLGDVCVTGRSSAGTFDDYATVKYNSAGQEQWVARHNGPGNNNDGATAMAIDGSGNVYVTGYSWGADSIPSDYATIKYNSAGFVFWDEQSGFNYNGRTDHGDGDLHS
jgi:hypothetical protein